MVVEYLDPDVVTFRHGIDTCKENKNTKKLPVYRPYPNSWIVKYISCHDLYCGYGHYKKNNKAYGPANLFTNRINRIENGLHLRHAKSPLYESTFSAK